MYIIFNNNIIVWQICTKLIAIIYFKERFAILYGNLSDNCNGTEHKAMLGDIMAVLVLQNFPLLQALVESFLAAANTLLHSFIFLRIWYTHRALYFPWSFTNIAIICFNTLSQVEPSSKTIAKYFDIWPFPRREWAVQPSQITLQNVNPKLIPESRLSFKFVRCKPRSVVWDSDISAINTQKSIIRTATTFPVLKNNLSNNVKSSFYKMKGASRCRRTHHHGF